MFKSAVLLAVFFLSISFSEAARHFAEVYESEGIWVVDHFTVEPNTLQELVQSKKFEFKFQALAFKKSIQKLSDKSTFRLVSTESAKPLWKVTQVWSESWEEKYSEWVSKNFNQEFFVKYDLATDCADVAYALRWIFSRNNGLPAHGTLAGTGLVVTHMSAKNIWDNLPGHMEWNKDKRFLAALNWLLDNVYTKTLYKDAFPVEISKQTIRPGLINLLGGHTEIIQNITDSPEDVPITVMSSTVPRAVRTLASRVYMDPTAVNAEYGGLLRFRWPVYENAKWKVIQKEDMPFYSLEQYKADLCTNETNFSFCLFKKTGMSFDPNRVYEKILLGIIESMKIRHQIAKEGYEFCLRNDCSPGSKGWEDHSTPTRDKRILNTTYEYENLMSAIGKSESFNQWKTDTTLPIENGISLSDFYYNLGNGLVSYDPRDSLSARWSTTPEGVSETVKGKYDYYTALRKELINKAGACRENPEKCRRSVSSINELSSSELDINRRNVVANWISYCKHKQCPRDAVLDKAHKTVWFESPAPWDTISLRQGELPAKEKVHLIPTTYFTRLGEKYLQWDSTIYDIENRKEIKIPEGRAFLLYEETTKKLVMYENNKVFLLNYNLRAGNSLSIELPKDIQPIIHDFGNGSLMLYWSVLTGERPDPEYNEFEGVIVDLQNETVGGKLFFTKAIGTERILYLHTDKEVFYLPKGNQLTKVEFPDIKIKISTFAPLKNERFLVSLTGRDLGLLSKEGMELLKDADDTYFYDVNSEITCANVSTEAGYESYCFNRSGEIIWKGSIQGSYKINEMTHLFVTYENKQHYLWIIEGFSFRKVSYDFGEKGPSIVGTSPDWIFLRVDNENQMIDLHTGNVVERNPLFYKGLCLKGTHMCEAEDMNFMFESFIGGSDDKYRFSTIGTTDGINIDEIYGYFNIEYAYAGGEIIIGSRTISMPRQQTFIKKDSSKIIRYSHSVTGFFE